MTSKIDAGGQGQFDDAIELPEALNALNIAPQYDVRQGSNFIDEEGALDLDLTSDEDENDDEGYDSQIEADAWEESMTRVDDEDWEIAEGGT